MLWLSGCMAILAAAQHNVLGAVIGCAAAGAAAIELHGCTLMRHGASRGLDWLIRSQFLLLIVIVVYAGLRIALFDAAQIEQQITPDIDSWITQLGFTRQEFIENARVMNRIVFTLVGVVSLIYQGAMARLYARRRPVVEQVLGGPETDEHTEDSA